MMPNTQKVLSWPLIPGLPCHIPMQGDGQWLHTLLMLEILWLSTNVESRVNQCGLPELVRQPGSIPAPICVT